MAPLLVLAGILSITLAVYGPARSAPFVYEDRNIAAHPALAFTLPSRMLSSWSLAQTADDAVRAHTVNLTLHLGCGLLTWWLARALLGAGIGPLLALAIQQWNPWASQAVLYVTGREELLLTLFVLLAMLAAVHRHAWLMTLSLIGALLSKEIGLIALPLIAITLRSRRRSLRPLVIIGALVLVGLAWNWYAVWIRIVTLQVTPMGLIVPWPVFVVRQNGLLWALLTGHESLAIDHDALMLSQGWLLGGVLATMGVCIAMVWAWRRQPILAWALGFTLVALLPRVLLGQNEFLSDRHLYLALLGPSVGLGALSAKGLTWQA